MKKIMTMALLAAMLMSLCACGFDMDTVFSMEVPAANAAAQAAVEAYTLPEKTAEVYWLTDSAAALAALEPLAARYTAEKGVTVTVGTAVEDYNATLQQELSVMNAPTLFLMDKDSIETYRTSLYPVQGAAFEEALLTEAFSIRGEKDELYAIPLSYSCYGLAADRQALYDAGHSAGSIHSLGDLKKTVEAITADQEVTAAAFSSDAADRFAELYGALLLQDSSVRDSLQELYDLIRKNSAEPDGMTAVEQLADGVCIFAFLSSEDYAALPQALTGAEEETEVPAETEADAETEAAAETDTAESETEDNAEAEPEPDTSAVVTGVAYRYGMLPMIAGGADAARGVFCEGTVWLGINKEADYEDIEATIAFLNWVLTDAEAVAALTELYGVVPYAGNAAPVNRFLADTQAMLAEDRSVLQPAGGAAQVWLKDLSNALESYAAAADAAEAEAAAKAEANKNSKDKKEEEEPEETKPDPWEQVEAVLNAGTAA